MVAAAARLLAAAVAASAAVVEVGAAVAAAGGDVAAVGAVGVLAAVAAGKVNCSYATTIQYQGF